MPFKVEGDEKLDCVINVRLSARERAQLIVDAQHAGLTISTLVRRRYFGRRVISRPYLKVVAELRRIGGLIKAAQLQTDSQSDQEFSAALRSVHVCIERLTSDREEDPIDQGQE